MRYFDLKGNVLPWMQGETYRNARRGTAYLRLKTEVTNAARQELRSPFRRLLLEWFGKTLPLEGQELLLPLAL